MTLCYCSVGSMVNNLSTVFMGIFSFIFCTYNYCTSVLVKLLNIGVVALIRIKQ